MKIMTPETRVGLLVIIAGMTLMYLSLKTTGVALWGSKDFKTVNMSFGSVAGVEVQSKVKLSGVEIGYVDSISLEDGHARVAVVLTRPDAVIRENAEATIRTAGLLGEKYIEIIQGTPDAPPLKNGATLSRTREPSDMSDIMDRFAMALDDIKSVTRSLKNVFGTMEGEKALKNILNNIDTASGNLKSLLEENRGALSSTIANFSTLSKEFAESAPGMMDNLGKVASLLREVLEENRGALSEGVTNLRKLTAEFNAILKENRGSLKTTMDNIAVASAKMDSVIDSVRNMSESIEKVASKIERGEGTVGKLVTDEAVYENLNSALIGANKFVNKAEGIRLKVGFRGEWQTDQGEGKSFASLVIQPREDKYYLLELSEDVRRSDLTTTRNTLNSLLYTILMAKRYSDVTVRAGLIESSAGAGVDYHAFGDRLMFSTDVFNLSGYNNAADNPQIKAQLRWNFQKYLYLYLGGDELLNDSYRTFFLGGGILFDEEDLKMALGLL